MCDILRDVIKIDRRFTPANGKGYLRFAGKWQGDDLEEHLKEIHEKNMTVKYSYDRDIDAIYFSLVDVVNSKDSEEIADGIIVDYDENDNIIGIEILDFYRKVENGLKIDDLPLTDEQKERMPKHLFI